MSAARQQEPETKEEEETAVAENDGSKKKRKRKKKKKKKPKVKAANTTDTTLLLLRIPPRIPALLTAAAADTERLGGETTIAILFFHHTPSSNSSGCKPRACGWTIRCAERSPPCSFPFRRPCRPPRWPPRSIKTWWARPPRARARRWPFCCPSCSTCGRPRRPVVLKQQEQQSPSADSGTHARTVPADSPAGGAVDKMLRCWCSNIMTNDKWPA